MFGVNSFEMWFEFKNQPTITLITWSFLVLSPNKTLTLIQGSSSPPNSWKKAAGTFASAVEIEEQMVKLAGRVEVLLSPSRDPKSLTKSRFCTGSLRPTPVSIASKAVLLETRRMRRSRILFMFIARSIDDLNAWKSKDQIRKAVVETISTSTLWSKLEWWTIL